MCHCRPTASAACRSSLPSVVNTSTTSLCCYQVAVVLVGGRSGRTYHYRYRPSSTLCSIFPILFSLVYPSVVKSSLQVFVVTCTSLLCLPSPFLAVSMFLIVIPPIASSTCPKANNWLATPHGMFSGATTVNALGHLGEVLGEACVFGAFWLILTFLGLLAHIFSSVTRIHGHAQHIRIAAEAMHRIWGPS